MPFMGGDKYGRENLNNLSFMASALACNASSFSYLRSKGNMRPLHVKQIQNILTTRAKETFYKNWMLWAFLSIPMKSCSALVGSKGIP